MILLEARNLTKHYGIRPILNDVSLSIDQGEKIGLIGINGTGKSTLLRILSSVEDPDSGNITTSRELVIEYLPQNPPFDENITVLEQIFRGTSPLLNLIRQYEETLAALQQNPGDETLNQQLMDISTQMDANNAWQLESEAKATLHKLGITDYSTKISTLSGGQRKRVALAGVLIRPCNLLILDEPTNHLDNQAISYLEEVLQSKKCALLMITHDRYFLDRVTKRIIELDNGKLYSYDGNYAYYLEQKTLQQEINKRMEEKAHALYKQELEWMRKGVEARRTKQKARIERFYHLEESLTNTQQTQLELMAAGARLGKKIISMENLHKVYGEKTVLENLTYAVVKTDRIGIIGHNGLGKSTLLNILAGKITDYSGILDIGDTVKIGYYTQDNRDLPEDMRLIDYIREFGEYITFSDGKKVSASKMLDYFLFPPKVQYAQISTLSGGEKRRLLLLAVLMTDANVLLLDEPTNDLDIQTLQILEDFLDNFAGPVITVSHDRYFLDRVCEKIFAFSPKGQVEIYTGNYSDYIRDHPAQNDVLLGTSKPASTDTRTKNMRLKFSYKESKEYETIEDDIATLEEKIAALDAAMVQASTDFVKLNDLTKEKTFLNAQLDEKMERWEYLSLLAEQIAAQK